jgi:hypothetical protein
MCVCTLCAHARDCVCVWCDGCVSVHVFVGEGFNNFQARPPWQLGQGSGCAVASESVHASTLHAVWKNKDTSQEGVGAR